MGRGSVGDVQTRPIANLKASATNARMHSPGQIKQIARSLEKWGWTVPILVDERNNVLAGHGRLLAAQHLGWTEAQVIEARGWTEAQKRAYAIADNKIAENATWDKGVLALELGTIREGFGFDLSLIGYSADELHKLLKDRSEGEDEVPEPTKKPRIKRGSVVTLGRHRLMCGDATSKADVSKLLAGAEPHLMVTDPPYGVGFDPAWRNTPLARRVTYGKSRTGAIGSDDRANWQEAWDLFPGDVAYVWHAGLMTKEASESIQASGFTIRAQIIWAKTMAAYGRGQYHWEHEPCIYAVRKASHWQGARDQSTLWKIEAFMGWASNRRGAENEATPLGAQKPVECMRRPMINSSERGDGVYDPFVGSGTSIIAAETVERACFAMEIDPVYCDVAIRRWEKFTGKAHAKD